MNSGAAKRKNRKIVSKRIRLALIYLFLAFEAFFFIFPYYLKLVESLHDLQFMGEYGVMYFFPQGGVHFENYWKAVVNGDLIVGFFNTLFCTAVSVGVGLVFAFVMGYVFGKIKFFGANVLFMCLLSTLMVPGEVLLVPLYFITAQLNLINTLSGVIIPGLLNVFGVFLFRQFMNGIPDSLIEAARIDGAGTLKIMFRIVFPMCLPIAATFVIINFTAKWNEYLWPSLILFNPSNYTLQLKMIALSPHFEGRGDNYIRAAALILITLPIVALFCCCQKYYLRSMNFSGIK